MAKSRVVPVLTRRNGTHQHVDNVDDQQAGGLLSFRLGRGATGGGCGNGGGSVGGG
jgi:hypothetical protein